MSSDVRAITIKVAKLADSYERVHFIGHTDYNPDLSVGRFKDKAGEIADGITAKTGYIAFVRDIRIKHYPPKETTVDFVIDAPAESPIAPLIVAAVIVVIIAVTVIVVVAWRWWTTWVEKVKEYICDQCPDYPSFAGWKSYLAHLAEFHPDKYEAAKDETPWWETVAIFGIAGLLILAAIMIVPRIVPKRKGE